MGLVRRVNHVDTPRINFSTLSIQNALSYISQYSINPAKVIRLRPKMAPPLLPTSASSSKQGRAGSLYSFEDSYSRGGNGNGVEAYTLPKGERGLPLVLRRLGKFKSMVCFPPLSACLAPFCLSVMCIIVGSKRRLGELRGSWEICRLSLKDRGRQMSGDDAVIEIGYMDDHRTTLMTGLRTCILAINIPNSITSESLQTDISPVRPISCLSLLPILYLSSSSQPLVSLKDRRRYESS